MKSFQLRKHCYYMGTVLSFPISKCLMVSPALIMASSKEKEQPIKKVTKSSLHTSLISKTSLFKSPFSNILYFGRSVLISILEFSIYSPSKYIHVLL